MQRHFRQGRTTVGIGVSWGNVSPKRRYPIAILAATATLAGAGSASANTITGTTYDPTYVPTSMYRATYNTGARGFWQAGYNGKGVDVAIIDTGVNRVRGLDQPGKVIDGPDLSFDSQNSSLRNRDGYGHGTHLAGIIAGNDDLGDFAFTWPKVDANNSAAFYGMAPNARIINLKVGASNGTVDVTQVIAALNWAVQHKNDNGMNIRVLCLAYGTDGRQDYRSDPLAFAVENAWKNGITVVTAAGNFGRNSGGKGPGLANPAMDPTVIAVGAQDARGTVDPSDDRSADFSSNGTDDWALTARSPDFTAPGVSLPSLRVPGSYLDRNYGGVAVVGTRFFKGSGSSQAAAVVAGAAALIISQRPYVTPDQVKALLRNGGIFVMPETRGAQGTGRMNLWSVLNRTVSETPGPAAPPSLGNGSVDVSRGSKHVSLNGTAITGNVDIFGHPFDSAALSGLAANTAAWSGGSWNGSTWTGSTWTGSTWTGSTWTGSTWTGSTWTGSTWTGSTWTGSTWTGDSWASALPPRKHPLKPVKH